MKSISVLKSSALALSLLATGVMAAVSPQEAAQLGTTLTPLGAEKAGNADGSIPAWTGGLKPGAAPVDANGFLGDPFANEKPLFVITAANVAQYKDKLTPGQQALFNQARDQGIGLAARKAQPLGHAMARTAGRPEGGRQQVHLARGKAVPG